MYEPKIVGFLCNWCSYAGADLAGVSRFNYPTNLRIIRVMCSGRVDPIFILNAFESGLDGVLVAGCHLGDCHYLSGNYQAKYKILLLKKILKIIGFNEERLRLEWVSAAEGRKFADMVIEFTKKLKQLGPTPIISNTELLRNMVLAKKICADFRLRWLISRARDLIEIQNAHGEKIPEEKFEKLLEDLINIELTRTKILELIEEKSLSVEEIAHDLGVPTEKIMKHLISLNDDHKVTFAIENHSARFIKAKGGEK